MICTVSIVCKNRLLASGELPQPCKFVYCLLLKKAEQAMLNKAKIKLIFLAFSKIKQKSINSLWNPHDEFARVVHEEMVNEVCFLLVGLLLVWFWPSCTDSSTSRRLSHKYSSKQYCWKQIKLVSGDWSPSLLLTNGWQWTAQLICSCKLIHFK